MGCHVQIWGPGFPGDRHRNMPWWWVATAPRNRPLDVQASYSLVAVRVPAARGPKALHPIDHQQQDCLNGRDRSQTGTTDLRAVLGETRGLLVPPLIHIVSMSRTDTGA